LPNFLVTDSAEERLIESPRFPASEIGLMATTQTVDRSLASRMIERIHPVLDAHQELSAHLESIQITVEGSRIVLRGHLPTVALKQALVPAIRQAGVLGQICNCVEIG
jgi:hypothetical protein